jgi:hypothetical protein
MPFRSSDRRFRLRQTKRKVLGGHMKDARINVATFILGLGMLFSFSGFPALAGLLRAGNDTKEPRWVELGAIEPEAPLIIGSQVQLLADNDLLCDWLRVRRVQERTRKNAANPVMEADKPWEQAAREAYGVFPHSVLYDTEQGVYKLWYGIITETGADSVIGYATSQDGIRWTKPDLGLVGYSQSPHNNICRLEPFGKPLSSGTFSLVLDDRRDVPSRRFKAIGVAPTHSDGGSYAGWAGIAFSSDGTTWRMAEGGTREGAGGGSPSVVWDEKLERYVLFQRQLIERALPGSLKRYIVRQESRDLVRWSPRQTAVNPMDEQWPELESMMVFRHRGIYFGLGRMLENNVRGEGEFHLLISRDGYRWEHPFPREAFIPRGPRGDFDDMIAWPGQVVIQGDEMKFYYGGVRYPHSKPTEPIVDDGMSQVFTAFAKGRLQYRPSKVGLATVPLDRLVGLRADEPVGAFLSRPFVVEGGELYVNANVDRELRIEVVNPVGQLVDTGRKSWVGHYIAGQEEVFSGFTFKDCQAITGDSLRHRVQWKGGSLGRFKGRAVRLRFAARMATVYAFQVR